MTASNLTPERLRELLHYNPETGIFTRRVKTARCTGVGDIAGTINPNEYVRIKIFGRGYTAHRLAWLYVTGAWPTNCIDHIDANKSNNRFKNLRDVTGTVNLQNQRKSQSDNISGFLGVHRKGKKFNALIQVSGKQKYLGTFITAEEAHAAYLEAKRRLHEGCTI